MARDWTKEYFDIKDDALDNYVKLKKQLAIAIEALTRIKISPEDIADAIDAAEALEQIEEIENE